MSRWAKNNTGHICEQRASTQLWLGLPLSLELSLKLTPVLGPVLGDGNTYMCMVNDNNNHKLDSFKVCQSSTGLSGLLPAH
jgi:hypothetical protein